MSERLTVTGCEGVQGFEVHRPVQVNFVIHEKGGDSYEFSSPRVAVGHPVVRLGR